MTYPAPPAAFLLSASGPPGSGTYAPRQWGVDTQGNIFVSAEGGSPGTFATHFQSLSAHLGSAFTSGSGTTATNVTGLAVAPGPGAWKVRGWFPYAGAGTVGSTQKFAFAFGGSAASSYVSWTNHAAAYSAPTMGSAVTTTFTTATITSTVYYLEFNATINVGAGGTLQLTVQSTTSGDEITIEAGASLEATQIE